MHVLVTLAKTWLLLPYWFLGLRDLYTDVYSWNYVCKHDCVNCKHGRCIFYILMICWTVIHLPTALVLHYTTWTTIDVDWIIVITLIYKTCQPLWSSSSMSLEWFYTITLCKKILFAIYSLQQKHNYHYLQTASMYYNFFETCRPLNYTWWMWFCINGSHRKCVLPFQSMLCCKFFVFFQHVILGRTFQYWGNQYWYYVALYLEGNLKNLVHPCSRPFSWRWLHA